MYVYLQSSFAPAFQLFGRLLSPVEGGLIATVLNLAPPIPPPIPPPSIPPGEGLLPAEK